MGRGALFATGLLVRIYRKNVVRIPEMLPRGKVLFGSRKRAGQFMTRREEEGGGGLATRLPDSLNPKSRNSTR
jgi:hypothetical protein